MLNKQLLVIKKFDDEYYQRSENTKKDTKQIGLLDNFETMLVQLIKVQQLETLVQTEINQSLYVVVKDIVAENDSGEIKLKFEVMVHQDYQKTLYDFSHDNTREKVLEKIRDLHSSVDESIYHGGKIIAYQLEEQCSFYLDMNHKPHLLLSDASEDEQQLLLEKLNREIGTY